LGQPYIARYQLLFDRRSVLSRLFPEGEVQYLANG
jgi:hypothetical protein